MHHATLYRPGPHNRHFNHQIVKFPRLQSRQHRHLRARFNLEYTYRIGPANHLVGHRVFTWHILHRKRFAAPHADEIERAPYRRQHAERQHVNLEQTHGVEIILVPLNDVAVHHGCIFNRHQARQAIARDDKAAAMLRQVARKADQLLGQAQQFLHHR